MEVWYGGGECRQIGADMINEGLSSGVMLGFRLISRLTFSQNILLYFEVLLLFAKVEIWGCGVFWWQHQQAFHENFLRENHIFCQFVNVFSLESFLLYSI